LSRYSKPLGGMHEAAFSSMRVVQRAGLMHNATPRAAAGPHTRAHLPGSRDLRFWASVTHLYCTLHTLSTSGTRRLNSSKQPQLPLAAAGGVVWIAVVWLCERGGKVTQQGGLHVQVSHPGP
jgi:hypothetical protein